MQDENNYEYEDQKNENPYYKSLAIYFVTSENMFNPVKVLYKDNLIYREDEEYIVFGENNPDEISQDREFYQMVSSYVIRRLKEYSKNISDYINNNSSINSIFSCVQKIKELLLDDVYLDIPNVNVHFSGNMIYIIADINYFQKAIGFNIPTRKCEVCVGTGEVQQEKLVRCEFCKGHGKKVYNFN